MSSSVAFYNLIDESLCDARMRLLPDNPTCRYNTVSFAPPTEQEVGSYDMLA